MRCPAGLTRTSKPSTTIVRSGGPGGSGPTLRSLEEDVPPDDLAGSQVAVVDPLRHVVLVDRLAEVPPVVGRDLGIRLDLLALLGELQLARGRRQADLHGIGIPGEHLRPLPPCRAMALVDDDVAEVILRVMRGQEVRVRLLGVHVERLVGGNQDPRVLLRLVTRDRSSVGAEDVVEGAETLGAQLVAVADEQGAAELPRVGDALEQVDGDERLPRSGREGEERALPSLRNPLQRTADGSILIVAPGRLATQVARQQRAGQRRLQTEAHTLLVTGPQLARAGEVPKGPWRRGLAREAVVLDEEMTVGGEDEGHIEPLGGRVRLALFEPVSRR
jgi:hypothetical protein